MKSIFSVFLSLPLMALVLSAEPIRVVFDTDMGNDVDDAIALSMLINKHKSEDIKLCGVLINKDNPWAAVYTDLVMNFYGADFPIGVVKDGKTKSEGRFIKAVPEMVGDDGKYLFARRVDEKSKLPESGVLLRKILEESPDNSVVYISVGFFTNLANFLCAPATSGEQSNLDLFTKKVKFISAMAGEFVGRKHKEYNVATDVEAFKKVLKVCRTPIVFSGFEIGEAVPYPYGDLKRNFGPENPVFIACDLYFKGKPHDRPTWDETSVLFAFNPDIFELSPRGTVTCSDDGVTSFSESDGGLHRYLKFHEEDDSKQNVVNAIVKSSSDKRERVKYKGSASHRN